MDSNVSTIILREMCTIQTIISITVGLCAGIFSSFVVNAALIEISISAFFSLYYGSIFIIIGIIILSRLEYHAFPDDPGFKRRKPFVKLFAILIIASGILSFFLEKYWFVNLNPITKIPLYGVVGAAISFCFVFAIVDLFNYIAGLVQSTDAQSVVDTPHQLYCLVVLSIIMGTIYGLIFGLMDVEDSDKYTIKLLLMKEEGYCFYIGIVIGAIGGFVNEFLRRNLSTFVFRKMENDPFSEEI